MTSHIIDCDANPTIPYNGWTVEYHRRHGQLFEWNLSKIKLWLSKTQEDEQSLKGSELRNLLENQPVLNANVLDFLVKNPDLIPEEWKDKLVFFWGTIYRGTGGKIIIRCLWFQESWSSNYLWDSHEYGSKDPAIVQVEN